MMGSKTAEILLERPEVVAESAEDDSPDGVSLQGTMFHDGLNANAWGLTEEGAEAVASSLEGSDLTAGHPPVTGYGFTRSIHEGQGTPIGEVANTEVTFNQGATMAGLGGGYTADYNASVLEPKYATKFENGLMVDGDYGVSVGIEASEEDANCSVCGANFAECKHYRGEEVDDKVAGPLYNKASADHLAVVHVPAFENADIQQVSSDQPMLATNADQFFGQPFDGTGDALSASSDSAADVREWSDGDLVEWQAVPDLFGQIVSIDEERQVAMVTLHSIVNGELVSDGYTITAGWDDLRELDADSKMEDSSTTSGGEQGVQVSVKKEPEFKLTR